jgi:hypothetical protein
MLYPVRCIPKLYRSEYQFGETDIRKKHTLKTPWTNQNLSQCASKRLYFQTQWLDFAYFYYWRSCLVPNFSIALYPFLIWVLYMIVVTIVYSSLKEKNILTGMPTCLVFCCTGHGLLALNNNLCYLQPHGGKPPCSFLKLLRSFECFF